MNGKKENIKENIKNKGVGCYVGLGAAALALVQTISYACVPALDFNALVIVTSILGIALFIVLSLFKVTTPYAPVALMVCQFLSLTGFVTDGLIDDMSTWFFDGVSLAKVPAAIIVSMLCIILGFIAASVAMYLPQEKRGAKAPENEEGQEKTEDKTEEGNGNEEA